MYDAALDLIGTPPSPISTEEYGRRVDRLTSQMRPGDLLIVPASSAAVHSNDVNYPYRTQSDLLYLVGWEEEEAVFTVHHEGGSWVRTLFVQPKDTLKEIWEGRRPGVEGALAGWATDQARSTDELLSALKTMISDATRILLRTGIRAELDELVVSALQRRDRARQHFGTGPITIEDPNARIAELRLRKS